MPSSPPVTVYPGEEFEPFFRVVVGSALKKRLQGDVAQEGATSVVAAAAVAAAAAALLRRLLVVVVMVCVVGSVRFSDGVRGAWWCCC